MNIVYGLSELKSGCTIVLDSTFDSRLVRDSGCLLRFFSLSFWTWMEMIWLLWSMGSVIAFVLCVLLSVDTPTVCDSSFAPTFLDQICEIGV